MEHLYPTRNEEARSYYYQCLADKKKDCQVEAVATLSLVVHPHLAKSFASILAWAYDQGDEDAKKVADQIGLEESHIYAVLNYEEEFEETQRGTYEFYSDEF